jgi:nicotinamide-nucleotide amidase
MMSTEQHRKLAERVAELAQDRSIAVAESLTSGAVASALGAAPDAARWFRGGIVAYSSDVKHGLLEVPSGPVVCADAAVAMAGRTAELLKADVVVSLTGAGGPDPQDGQPPGTVWFGRHGAAGTTALEQRFEGSPEEVVDRAVTRALEILLDLLG